MFAWAVPQRHVLQDKESKEAGSPPNAPGTANSKPKLLMFRGYLKKSHVMLAFLKKKKKHVLPHYLPAWLRWWSVRPPGWSFDPSPRGWTVRSPRCIEQDVFHWLGHFPKVGTVKTPNLLKCIKVAHNATHQLEWNCRYAFVKDKWYMRDMVCYAVVPPGSKFPKDSFPYLPFSRHIQHSAFSFA